MTEKRMAPIEGSPKPIMTTNSMIMKEEAEVPAEQPDFASISLEKQATSGIDHNVIYSKEESEKTYQDLMNNNLFGQFLYYIERKILNPVNLQPSGYLRERNIIKSEDLGHSPGVYQKNVDSSSRDHINNQKKDVAEIEDLCHMSKCDSGVSDPGSLRAFINQQKEYSTQDEDHKTYIKDIIKSEDLGHSPGVNEKNVDSNSSRDHGNTQKKNVSEIDDLCHMSKCDSGVSDLGSLQGFKHQEDVDDEYRKGEEDHKTYIKDNVRSEDLGISPGVNRKNGDSSSRDHGNIEKKDFTEIEDLCLMSKCDSGVSDLGSLHGLKNQEDVDDEYRKGEEDNKTYIKDITSEDLSHSPCVVNGKDVCSASGDPCNIQKQDVTENENFCRMCKCNSGVSGSGSLPGSMVNEEEVYNEGEGDTKTDSDDPPSGTLNPHLHTYLKERETWERDNGHVQKKHVTENGVSHVTTFDSGFSDPGSLQTFTSYKGNDSTHPAGEKDDKCTLTRVDPQSCQSLDPAPNLNPDNKLFGMGNEVIIDKQDCKGEPTSAILGASEVPNPKNLMSATQTKEEINTKHSTLKKVPHIDASVPGPLQDIKSPNDQDTRHHKEDNDNTQNRKDNRRPVTLDPDPNHSTTCTKRDKSATGDQGRMEAKPPAEKEDISHATSCDSDILNLASVRPPELTSQKDCDSSECPKEDGKVDVTNKNDGGQRIYSKPDSELICTSLGDQQAEGDPIPERSNKKIGGLTTLIKTGYSRVPVIPVPFLFIIALIFTPSVMSALNNMNPVWYKEGDNAIIYFSFESYDAESTETIWNVRMESMQLPFYSNGIIPEGFKDESQNGRFSVSVDRDCIQINITGFQREDEDEYIVTQVFLLGDGSRDRASWNTELKFLPPAQCSILNGSSLIFVQCSVAVASPETELYCFHGISFCSPYHRGDIGLADGQAEFRMKNSGEPIRCCSKAQVDPLISIFASHETCHDFIWPPTMPTTPTSTLVQDGMAPSTKGVILDGDGGTPPYQTIPHTPSSCSRLRNVPSLIIALVLSWFLVWVLVWEETKLSGGSIGFC